MLIHSKTQSEAIVISHFYFATKYFCVYKWGVSVKSIKKDRDYCKSGSERIFHPDWKVNSLLLNEVFSFVSNFKFNTYPPKNGFGYKIIFNTQ